MPKVVVVFPPHPELDSRLLAEFGELTCIYSHRRDCNVYDPKHMVAECERWAINHWDNDDYFAFVGPVVATALAYAGISKVLDGKKLLIWSNERKLYDVRYD